MVGIKRLYEFKYPKLCILGGLRVCINAMQALQWYQGHVSMGRRRLPNASCYSQDSGPRVWGLRGPHKEDYDMLEFILGSPAFGSYHVFLVASVPSSTKKVIVAYSQKLAVASNGGYLMCVVFSGLWAPYFGL